MADDAHRVTLPGKVPAALRKDILGKLYYADPRIAHIDLEADSDLALVRTKEPMEALPPEIAAKMAKIMNAMTQGVPAMAAKVYFDRSSVAPPYAGDIYADLLAGGHIAREGHGLFAFGPLFMSVMAAIDGLVTDFARTLGAQEHGFPTLIPAQTLKRCNYFASFPHSLTLAFHLPEDIEVLEGFSRAAQDEAGPTIRVSAVESENALSPAVCYHAYSVLEGLTMEPGQEGRTILCKGKCFRYESGNMNMVERMWDFTMREIVFIGAEDWVLARRQVCLQWVQGLLDELGLRCRIETASDPFFAGDAMKKSLFQKALELKYEIVVNLPHSGGWLAVGSLNFHQDFFGRTFSIQAAGQPARTGCTAFGVERFALAFLAQHGLDPAAWPAAVRDRI